jgi:endo-1,3(4)-beta-glucanase
MSWFDGHSFASGLFPFGNGKSQESSSEAVNAYFGAYLWSMVRESQDDTDSELSDFARLLLAMEIRGAQSYWHMEPPPAPTNSSTSTVPYLSYNSNFTKNYMVGNLGMLDAVCSTWFGTASLYVHMINFLPVTAITSELFDKPYVRKEFENVIGPLLPDVEMAWRGYVICDHAIIDPVAAWTEAQTLVSYELDAAISKSQVLYWISTRPGFALNASSVDKVEPTSPSKTHGGSSSDSSSSASCESHPGCSGQGLSGLCCPTSDGVMLTCCSDSSRL